MRVTSGRVQNVSIEEGTTVFTDGTELNELAQDVEVTDVVLNMEGGARIDGSLTLSTVEVNTSGPGGVSLIPSYLQTLTIDSTGTGSNVINGETANVIDGDITPAGDGTDTFDNNLKTVSITADQDLIIGGEILFSSHGSDGAGEPGGGGTSEPNEPDDGITANDDNEATATLNVDGASDVTIGDLNTNDDDVDFLVVNHTGDGTLTFGLSSLSTVDADDEITVNGSATGDTIINISGTLDLSDDTLNDVDALVLDESGGISGSASNVELTLSQAQLNDVGAGNITVNEVTGQTATLNINAFDGSVPFDATALDPAIDDVAIFMAEGVQTLDATTDLTGVDSITVPEEGTLNLTAAQFQQLDSAGDINGVDADGNSTSDYTVNITDLTQADVDAGFDLTDISADNINVTLGEPEVTLAELDEDGLIVPGTDAAIAGANFILGDNQVLNLSNSNQADGLDVTGGTDSVLTYQFASMLGSTGVSIDASGYDVTTLKALATFVGGTSVENLIDELDSSVVLQLFEDPEEMGFLNPTDRIVFVEEGVTVPADGSGNALIFNDFDTDDEVRSVLITLDGDVTVEGDIAVPTMTGKDSDLIQQFLESLSLVSQGDDPNVIVGGIDTQLATGTPPTGTSTGTVENNLLDITINATQELSVLQEIVFNNESTTPAQATLTVTGDSDVSIKALDTTDATVSGLTVDNAGTGTLTITGGSDALELDNTESLVFEGTGDIVLDTDTDAGNNGIDAETLETLDASAT